MDKLTCVELCAGGGGQALGLEQADFAAEALVERDKNCCATLRGNRPVWNVIEGDLADAEIQPGLLETETGREQAPG